MKIPIYQVYEDDMNKRKVEFAVRKDVNTGMRTRLISNPWDFSNEQIGNLYIAKCAGLVQGVDLIQTKKGCETLVEISAQPSTWNSIGGKC